MPRFVTADELDSVLGTSRAYIYEHAGELGARRLGSGPRARLRFDLDDALERAMPCSADRESAPPSTAVVKPIRRRRQPSRLGTDVELLPIRGQSPTC